MELFERTDLSPEQTWIAGFVAAVLTITGGAVVFTRQIYHGFLWRYFWGPVYADAEGVNCFVRFPGEKRTIPGTEAAHGCSRSAYENAFVAEPGYTLISTAGYIAVLVFMLAGVYLLIQRFDLRPHSRFFFALVPFMLFGGVLRTVEDAFVAAKYAGKTPAIEFPASAALISPFIYFTVFFIALSALLVSTFLDNREITETYYYPLAALGTGWLTVTFGYLLVLAGTTEYVSLYPGVLAIVLGVAAVTALLAYRILDQVWPVVNEGTGQMGIVVIWGHTIDGAANVLANDWSQLWNLGEYTAKHPFNRFLIDTTNAIQGGGEVAGIYIGTAWPFFIVKLIVPILILSVFDEQFFEESPRFAVLLLGAIVAVGLGPGTRDMVRLALGI